MNESVRVGERFVLGFKGQRVPRWLAAFSERFGLGGVILFDYDAIAKRYGNNIASPGQLSALCEALAALPAPPLVFVDQEGGKVRRLKEGLGFQPLPSAEAFARLDAARRLELARASYAELRALGVHVNLAPVIDLNTHPANPDIGAHGRAYSAEPREVRENVRLLDQAAREAGLGLCLKHYPGLGGARVNSHDEITDLTGTFGEAQLDLFRELAPGLPGEAILVSHGLVRDWDAERPVSISPAALARLREELPEVLLISDDLQMEGLRRLFPLERACREGIAAGLDLLLIGNNLRDEQTEMAGLAEALEADMGRDPALAERHAASLERIAGRKRRLGVIR